MFLKRITGWFESPKPIVFPRIGANSIAVGVKIGRSQVLGNTPSRSAFPLGIQDQRIISTFTFEHEFEPA